MPVFFPADPSHPPFSMETSFPQNTPFHAPKPMTPPEQANWRDAQLKDTWRVFRIMSEFVEGFETLSRVGPSVSVFGSARTPPDHPTYALGVEVGRLLAERGYAVITGGGPGVMEAANKGAQEGGGVSVGLNIVLPHEQGTNRYVDPGMSVDFEFFFARKTMFVKYAQGYIVLPGGFGTMDELFESLTLIQTRKAARFPIVLMGVSYWSGLVSWLDEHMREVGNISPADLDLFHLTDSAQEAVDIVDRFCQAEGIAPNF